MDNLTFVANLVNALAWPLATTVIVILLRGEILSLLGRIKKIQYKDSTIVLANKISDAQSADKMLNNVATEKTPELERIGRLAEDSPRGAIIDSCLLIEKAMSQYAMRYGIDNQNSHSPLCQLIERIRLNNPDVTTLGKGVIEMLEKLGQIRNYAAHQTDADITPAMAKDYAALAVRAKARLEEA